tara:strand:+ start:2475 stop:2606 length:132 start_codon:yes stop_codon:yes gene_type:complete
MVDGTVLAFVVNILDFSASEQNKKQTQHKRQHLLMQNTVYKYE